MYQLAEKSHLVVQEKNSVGQSFQCYDCRNLLGNMLSVSGEPKLSNCHCGKSGRRNTPSSAGVGSFFFLFFFLFLCNTYTHTAAAVPVIMGYTTTYTGAFAITPPLDDATFTLLRKLGETRRMIRDMRLEDPDGSLYGVEGELYVDDEKAKASTIVDSNTPPRSQPGLWCHWIPTEDRAHLEWDGGEKFYYGANWLVYLIDRILKPRGYVMSGNVDWEGEDGETGTIAILANVVTPAPDNMCFAIAAMYRDTGERIRRAREEEIASETSLTCVREQFERAREQLAATSVAAAASSTPAASASAASAAAATTATTETPTS